jgi:hypothetical protein
MRLSQTHLWGLAGLLARLAPVSVVPILIRLYDHAEVDWFVLVQTNAALVAVILAFSQSNFIQQNYSEETKSELVIFTSIVPIGILLIAAAVTFSFVEDFRTGFYSLLLGFFMSYVPQSQAILRCAGLYSLSIYADILRVFAFGVFALVLFVDGSLPIEVAVLMMATYYLLPYLVFAAKVVRTFRFGAIPRIWRASIPYLLAVVFSVLLSAATLALLRYILLDLGEPGDLAAYAAIYSVASLLAVIVDFVYIRMGQNIVVGARNRDRAALVAVARKIARPVLLATAVALVISVAYSALQLPRPDGSTVIAAIVVVGSFALRSIYIFFQNILVGLKVAKFDFFASGASLAVVALIGPYLIAWQPLVGAAVAFLLISLTYVITLGSVVSQLRDKP